MAYSNKRVLVTGAGGMLAHDVAERLSVLGANLLLVDIREVSVGSAKVSRLDITDLAQVSEFVEREKPALIINCAAYTAVDDAEKNLDRAFSINAIGPRNLALAAKSVGAVLVHFSTDYVFGNACVAGKARKPFSETDEPQPCGVYGQSKRMGDELVQAILPDHHLLLRTSWLHGAHGPNFIATILKLAGEREMIKVVDDQIGSPTWSGWLADVLVRLLKRDARGTFHVSSRGNVSWFEFAREILRQAGLPTRVLPQTTEQLGRPAPRPPFSTFDVSKLESFLGEPCISWQEGIRRHLQAIGWRVGGR